MSEFPDKDGDDGTGFRWRLRQSDKRFAPMENPVAIELADADGLVLATVSMPSETLNGLLSPHLSLFAELQLDGTLSLDSEFFALFAPSKATNIYELVKEGIALEMLEDESDVKGQLSTLRQRLTDALELVDQTLADLDKSES